MLVVGAVLRQRSDAGVDRPVSFFSKKLNTAQQKYSIEHECLVVLTALEKFRV